MAPEEFRRKLSAILSADAKGYSRLMGEDEEGTIRTLKAYMEVINGFIQQHRGRIVGTAGDNVLAEFASVVDAVRCAVGIQEELKDRNKELPEERRMEFRIGGNLGDVVEEGENILGDGVNVAARMESLAEAGGICISGTAYDQVKNKLAFGYEYIGEQTVKNIKEPVRVYRVLMEPEIKVSEMVPEKKAKPRKWQRMFISLGVVLIVVAASLAIWRLYLRPTPPPREVAFKQKMAYPLPDKPSIVVLPFVNMSKDPKQESFSDGLTENITTTLAKIPELFVIARNSAFEYKGNPLNVKKVAENLGVRYVLEGSIQKSTDRNRITAQLIDATSGYHIWSEKYDRKVKDFFALSDEISRKIAVALQIKLTEGETARIWHRYTENLEAWSIDTQAWDFIQRGTREDNARAIELSKQAVKLDPQSGFAWSLLACSYFNAARYGWSESPEEYFKKATELNHKALSLDKNLFCATAMLGQIHMYQGQYEQAIELGRRSIELGPSIPLNNMILASILRYTGNFEEAIAKGEEAIRLHPFCPLYYQLDLAMSYRMAGRYEEALALYKQILKRAQKETSYLWPTYIGLADVYSEMGRVKEAHTQALEILRIDPSFSLENWKKTEPFRDPKHLEKRLIALRKAGLK